MRKKLKKIFKEPSTWAGISAPVGVLGTQIPEPWSYVCYVLTAVCSVLAVVLREERGEDAGANQ